MLEQLDIIPIILSFLEEDDFFNLKKVNKELNKIVKIQYISSLKITKKNLYLLDFDFSKFKNLKKLDCSDNRLTEIPHVVGLQELNCSHNNLTEIPHIVGLQLLNYRSNKLTEIPHIVGLQILN